MSINVTVVGTTNVVASVAETTIGVSVGSPGSVDVGIGTMVAQAVTGLLVAGGNNVTVTTTSGVFTIAAADAPVSSVNGKTGAVVLNATDVGAASNTHGHSYVQSLNSLTGTLNVLAGSNITISTSSSGITIVGSAGGGTTGGAVSSVNGRTGTVTLVASDVSAASSTHAHSYVQSLNSQTGTLSIVAGDNVTISTSAGFITITGSAGGTGGGSVTSVNGRTGVVTLVSTDVSAASAVHTHTSANITDFTTEAAKVGPVSSVNGRTGTVTLVASDVSAASASHTHVAASITDLTSVANVVSVNGQTGVVSIATGGNPTAVSVDTKSPSANPTNNYDAGSTDVVRLSPSSGLTITGLSGGSSGVVRLLVNVTTHEVVLSSGNTNSVAENRFVFTGADRILGEHDSASVFYDATSQRWRLIADEPAAPPYHWDTVTATATLHNYAPGTATVLRIVASGGNRFIGGFSGGAANKSLRVINVSTHNLTLYHESNGSDEQNRLLLDSGTDRALNENDQAELLYDPVSMRWRVTPCCGVSS